MDRRMYRRPMGMGSECGYNKNVGMYKPMEPVCREIVSECPTEKMYAKNECEEECIDQYPIGMCYVPWQCYRNIYENEYMALARGTMFKELDLEWYGGSCK